MVQTDPDELIQTAINWACSFTDKGVPDDLTAQDAVIKVRPIHETLMESSDPLANDYNEWAVIFRGQWAVDLDSMGIPHNPPRRIM